MNPTEPINDQLNRSNGYVDQLNYRYSFFVESIIYVLSRITYPHPGWGCHS